MKVKTPEQYRARQLRHIANRRARTHMSDITPAQPKWRATDGEIFWSRAYAFPATPMPVERGGKGSPAPPG